jgi:hypothetical protein
VLQGRVLGLPSPADPTRRVDRVLGALLFSHGQ